LGGESRTIPDCEALVKGVRLDSLTTIQPSRRFDQLRVLIADDHRLFAESLRALLCADERIDVIGIAASGDEAVNLAVSLVPDVVLMDFNMPGLDGLTATRTIREREVPCRILLLTGEERGDLEEARALEAGADGFVRKEQSVDRLREVFFDVAALTSALAVSNCEN
jgi:DNA-binding NarL/FixJ family response regulator